MAQILTGAPVAAALNEKTLSEVSNLKTIGIEPALAIFRVGERADDISYEKGAIKRCGALGIGVKSVVLPADVDSDTFFKELDGLNRDPSVHGILMFRPLPKQIDNERARKSLNPDKDIDGCTDGSLAGVFANSETGFPPCTAQAAVEMLDYYGVDCAGKRVCIIGRSLVVGRPAAMLLMHKNATVTICHTKTENMPEIAGQSDILIVCAGKTETVGEAYFRPGQIVIDVGIGWSEAKQKLCGDVKFDEAEQIVSAVSPVPGGVGSVTTSVLASHVVEAARRSAK